MKMIHWITVYQGDEVDISRLVENTKNEFLSRGINPDDVEIKLKLESGKSPTGGKQILLEN